MASDGLLNRAKRGKCRICRRVRCTDKYVKAVGEVRHGFATGHIWECKDEHECKQTALARVKDKSRSSVEKRIIMREIARGRLKEYEIRS